MLKKLIDIFKRYLKKYKNDKQNKELLKEQEFICYYPKCKTVVNDSICEVSIDEYYIYTCPNCLDKSVWRFDISQYLSCLKV